MCETNEVIEVSEATEEVERNVDWFKKDSYQIHESKMEKLEKKLKTIQKKCAKYGVPFAYEIEGSKVIDVETDKAKEPNLQKYFIVKVSGDVIVNGWEFIATLEFRGEENIIRRYNQTVELPERFRKAHNVCEHCNADRNRKELYVVRNVETNEFKQIGKSCLKEYTKGLSAELVAYVMEARDMIEDEESDNDGFGFSGSRYHEVKTIIGIAYALTKNFGFCRSDGDRPTRYRISELLFSEYKALEEWNRVDKIYLSHNDFYSDEVYEMADTIANYFLNLDDSSEFIHNVKVIIKDGYCDSKDFGILASLPYCYERGMIKKKEQEQKDAEIAKAKENDMQSVYFGEVGQRYNLKNLVLTRIASFDTLFGIMHIYKIVDVDNHVFIWKTGTSQDEGQYDIALTVKAHGEYNGIMQTEVTRCKLKNGSE